ncbi:chorismate mutase [Pseudaminobacter arsenicus]|uniref:chorismate mutase n=1 Tax=Borborobacter arsenicus TaxID=1851146 RepID=A0A432V258_9HYPH|nr:chorismate mutase [Pseudaminobacter arsenicus]
MSGTMDTRDPQVTLAELRASIDNIDASLIHMLAERFRCTKAVGVLKATHGLPPADPAREQRQIARLRQLADEAHLDPDFAEKFLNFIIREVIRHHEAIAAASSGDTQAASNSGNQSPGLDKNSPA